MTVKRFKKLFTYNFWANDRVWKHILELSDEQFHHPSNYSIGSIHEQCVHQMGAEELWFDRISGNNKIKAFATTVDYLNREDISTHWKTIKSNWMNYINTLTEDDLTEDMTFTSVTYGTKFTNERWEGLMQVLNHSTDHRAQILSLVHQVGGETDAQDWIFYLWDK